jgi:putative ABC transport system permease protein
MRNLSSRLPHQIRRLFRLPLTRQRMLRDIDEEIAFHLAMRTSELRAAGMSEEDAAREAQRRFGDAADFRAHAARRADRRARRLALVRWVEECRQDLRLAVRQFLRVPAFGAVIVLTLGICIGATTAMYGVVSHLLLSPLPYPDGNRIVSVEARGEGDGDFRWQISSELYRTWAARSHTLEDFAAFHWGTHALREPSPSGGVDDSVAGAVVTPSFLSLLGVRPALGRGFLQEDARSGAPGVVLLGDSIWRSRFGGSPDVIGRTVTVDGSPRTIIGVLPPRVGNPLPSVEHGGQLVFLPLDIQLARGVDAFARLRPGVTSAAASRELEAILRTLPDTGDLHGARAAARTAQDRVAPERRHGVEVVFVAATALLLIACADIAGLLLIRGWTRRREFAIRQAIGAGRMRLARQLFVESLFLAIPAGALGVVIAWLGLRVVRAVGPAYLTSTSLDTAALLWATMLSVATALAFGFGPALLAWERSLGDALRSGGARAGQGRGATRAHATLVVSQIALCLIFLATAAVLARSFVSLMRERVGYEPEGLFGVEVQRISPPRLARDDDLADEARVAIMRTVREALAVTPGVSEVAAGPLPLRNVVPAPSSVEGASGVRPTGLIATGGGDVDPDYFRVTRIALVRGRGFDANPTAAAREVIINESLARRLFPNRDALGARLRWSDSAKAPWLTVVGIAADVHMPGEIGPEFFRWQVYTSPASIDRGGGFLLVRARGHLATLRPLLARAIERAGVQVKLRDVVNSTVSLEFAYQTPRFALVVFGLFTLLAVALAAVGLFGIIAHTVARRTREIGIRVALGADSAGVTRMVLTQTIRLVVVGCGVGLVSAYAARSTLSTVVYGLTGTDPLALGGSVLIVLVVALCASVVPVRRALRVDPMNALRAE